MAAAKKLKGPPCALAFANGKGGCGKTTLVANLGVTAASDGVNGCGHRRGPAQADRREHQDRQHRADGGIDKATVARNCDVWGPKCTRAKDAQAITETKLTSARAVLKTHGVEVDDSMARRIVAYLPFLTKDQVLLFQPLLQPLGLAVIGSLLIAIGLRGGKVPEIRVIEAMPRPAQPAPARSSSRVVAAPLRVVDPSEDPFELDPNPVVAFLKRKLAVARGANADVAEIYDRFLQDWHEQGHDSDPLTPAQFGHVINYICREARIRMERRGKRVVCVDRKLIV